MQAKWKGVGVIVVAGAAMLFAACLAPDRPCGEENCESISRNLLDPCEASGVVAMHRSMVPKFMSSIGPCRTPKGLPSWALGTAPYHLDANESDNPE